MCAAPDFESSAITRRKSSSALLNSPLFNACAPWEKSTEGSCAEVAVLCDQTSISFLPAGKVASGIAQRDWQPPAISRQRDRAWGFKQLAPSRTISVKDNPMGSSAAQAK